ncbi:hypothetical protein [Pseudoalteromonas sp. XMcav11-Q]|uniref:hypothetical protein n=1 Tax=Pseudoalteromonas sp. XMcav11-Q TaxID=3136665 RepID=UPI0032C49FEB
MAYKVNRVGLFEDKNGKAYEILEKVEQITTRPLSGPERTYDGMKDYVTSCGKPVNLENGVYKTFDGYSLKAIS